MKDAAAVALFNELYAASAGSAGAVKGGVWEGEEGGAAVSRQLSRM